MGGGTRSEGMYGKGERGETTGVGVKELVKGWGLI